jgi:hypothetical protein
MWSGEFSGSGLFGGQGGDRVHDLGAGSVLLLRRLRVIRIAWAASGNKIPAAMVTTL